VWIGPLVGLLLGAPAADRIEVAVAGIEFSGDEDPRRRSAFEDALDVALSEAQFAAVAIERPSCDEPRCYGEAVSGRDVGFVLRARVSFVDHDYSFALDLFAAGSADPLATAVDRCDLCGTREAIDAFSGAVAALRDRVDALRSTRPRLSLRSDPSGATVILDGTTIGTTPLDVEVGPGPHVVAFTKPGYRERQLRLSAVAGITDRHAIVLPRDEAIAPRRVRLAVGGTLLGLGLAAIPAGAGLLVIDGDPRRRDCRPDIEGRCQFSYRTLAGGIALVGSGIAAAIVGATLVGLVHRARRRSDHRPSSASSRARRAPAWPAPSVRARS
jgi:hypothetical protein